MFNRGRIRELERELAAAREQAKASAQRAKKMHEQVKTKDERAKKMQERVKAKDERIRKLEARFGLPEESNGVVEDFHQLYYNIGIAKRGTWTDTYWFGVPAWKCPTDLWVYQEILFEARPDWVVETGTAHGGSALYLAHIMDALGEGNIVSVDIEEKPDRTEHPRVTYLTGSSTDTTIVEEVRSMVGGGTALVVLDSDHSKDHVLGELAAYSGLVPPGGHLIVEDTNVNGHPVLPNFGPGPMEAVEEFLAGPAGAGFSVDGDKEKLLLTFNPRGFLKKAG